MYVLVIGGGTVAYGLALELAELPGYEVLIVERDRARANALREEAGELVVQGDGSEVAFLEKVGAARADVLIAATGDDGVNLVACQVAKHRFGVPRTIARVNDPRNERLFSMLGVDSTVSSAAAVLAQIEIGLPEHTDIPLMRLRDSGLEVVNLHVQEGSAADGRLLRELSLPPETVIALVFDNAGSATVPSGDTPIEAGYEVIAVIRTEAEPVLRRLLTGPGLDGDEGASGR